MIALIFGMEGYYNCNSSAGMGLEKERAKKTAGAGGDCRRRGMMAWLELRADGRAEQQRARHRRASQTDRYPTLHLTNGGSGQSVGHLRQIPLPGGDTPLDLYFSGSSSNRRATAAAQVSSSENNVPLLLFSSLR